MGFVPPWTGCREQDQLHAARKNRLKDLEILSLGFFVQSQATLREVRFLSWWRQKDALVWGFAAVAYR